jgi:hypothetical protein
MGSRIIWNWSFMGAGVDSYCAELGRDRVEWVMTRTLRTIYGYIGMIEWVVSIENMAYIVRNAL